MPAAAETRALIERFIAALNSGSIGEVVALAAGEVVVDPNQQRRVIGREAFESYLIHRARCYDERLADVVVMVAEDGHRGAAEYTLRGTYRATDDGLPPAQDQSYSVNAGSFFEVDEGRVSRFTIYFNREELIAQLGR
jgi:steroid delta-isomerase-like uncharacterized protein